VACDVDIVPLPLLDDPEFELCPLLPINYNITLLILLKKYT